MKLLVPANNVFVDDSKKIVDPWLDFIRNLRFTGVLTEADVTTLKTLITVANTPVDPAVAAAAAAAATYVVNYQYFSASGTWIKPASGFGTVALIRCWGGAGSGASVSNPATPGDTQDGGGGGGGGFVDRWVVLSSLGSTEAVTIGPGGAGIVNPNVGNAGTDTTFGSWVLAPGGGGGTRASNATTAGGYGAGLSAGSTGVGATPGSTTTTAQTARNGDAGGAGGSGQAPGGDAYRGGGGGGGIRRQNGGANTVTQIGGVSVLAGNGGASAATNGVTGSFPSGGGGACYSGTSGDGAAGQCEVYVF